MEGNPVNHFDEKGLDYWIEGQGSCERGGGFHQSICVGKFGGQKTCYAFGSDDPQCKLYGAIGKCIGMIYPDTCGDGNVIDCTYVRTSPEIDSQIIGSFNQYLGTTGNYSILTNNCRHFAQATWRKLRGEFGGKVECRLSQPPWWPTPGGPPTRWD